MPLEPQYQKTALKAGTMEGGSFAKNHNISLAKAMRLIDRRGSDRRKLDRAAEIFKCS